MSEDVKKASERRQWLNRERKLISNDVMQMLSKGINDRQTLINDMIVIFRTSNAFFDSGVDEIQRLLHKNSMNDVEFLYFLFEFYDACNQFENNITRLLERLE